eukprot:scaffold104010_cov29-Tisochrysis_lutea.AAC.1
MFTPRTRLWDRTQETLTSPFLAPRVTPLPLPPSVAFVFGFGRGVGPCLEHRLFAQMTNARAAALTLINHYPSIYHSSTSSLLAARATRRFHYTHR